MARIQVKWVAERDIKSFPEIACEPGYYLDVLTGDIFRNAGHLPAANLRILDTHPDHAALSRKAFLLVSPVLDLTIGEIKHMIQEKFGVSPAELGKLVYSID
ncbi:hypothetical protein J7643_01460 [bacterium]|nr:hypothetical protein [bacterium]